MALVSPSCFASHLSSIYAIFVRFNRLLFHVWLRHLRLNLYSIELRALITNHDLSVFPQRLFETLFESMTE